MSPVLQQHYSPDTALRGLSFNAHPALMRYNVAHPALLKSPDRTPTHPVSRQPLKPIQRTSVPPGHGNRLPIVRRLSDNQSAAEVDRMCKLIEKHDEQLQLISNQIETLLSLQKQVSGRPVTVNAETMTSKIWSPTEKDCTTPSDQRTERRASSSGKSDVRSSGRGILRKTVTHDTTRTEQSFECGRAADDENGHFFHTMLSDISDILSRSSETDDSVHIRRSPVKKHCPARNNGVERNLAVGNAGSETIYINNLAAKYLPTSPHSERLPVQHQQTRRHSQSPAHKNRYRKSLHTETRKDVTSIATKNYLQRYGLSYGNGESGTRCTRTRPKNKLLDLSRLDRLPKFV